jgi:hypothetical protein
VNGKRIKNIVFMYSMPKGISREFLYCIPLPWSAFNQTKCFIRCCLGHPSKYAPTSTMHMKLPVEKETFFPRALFCKKANVTANAKRKKDNAELRNKRRMEKNITDL